MMIRVFVTSLAQPLPLLLIALGVTIGYLVRRLGWQAILRWLVMWYAVFVVSSLPATAYLLMASLESYYPSGSEPHDAPDAIVVLAGYMARPVASATEVILGEDVVYRCLTAQRVARHYPQLPIIVSGGPVRTHANGVTHASLMKSFLEEQGMTGREIIQEDRSLTTHENARYTAEILRSRHWHRVLVITDASHLLRSDLSFRGQGIEVIGSGSRYYTHDFAWTPAAFIPSPSAWVRAHIAMHEWLGLAWYKLRGYI